MVTHVSPLFAIFVSPHKPMTSSSCTIAATILDIESGNTFVSASTHSTISYRSGDTPVHLQIELKNSYSKVVMRSSNITRWRKAMSTI